MLYFRHGFPVKLTPEVLDRASQVMMDMNLSENNQKYLSFFTVYGLDLFEIGSLKTRFGALVGLPRSFSYSSVDNIEKNDIVVSFFAT